MDSKYVKFCPNCNITKQNSYDLFGEENKNLIEFMKGYLWLYDVGKNDNICPCCQYNGIIDSVFTEEEFEIIQNINTNSRQFLDALVKLKESNPVEFQLKMSQFKTQLQQQESTKQTENTPKCITCGSTNIKKISTTAKVAGAVAFGLFSKTAKSQFKCENCGCKW